MVRLSSYFMPCDSCSVTYYDLLKPIAFSFVGNFSQTLQFILCPVYYLRLVAFWTILTRVQLLLRLASKSSRFLLFLRSNLAHP